MTVSSYTSDTHPDLELELGRLRNQALLGWDKEARNLAWFGLRPDMALLEIGCGPGFVTEQLLELVPAGTVTALEVDPGLLARAAERLDGSAPGRLQFVEASVAETGLPDDTFDFVVCRFVLQHLPDPLAALREIHRVLKPGGRVVVTDSDDALWGVLHPEIPELAPILAKRAGLQARLGGDRLVGRKLPALLAAAGLGLAGIEALAISSADLGLDALRPQLDPARLALLVERGVISAEQLAALAAARDRFLAAPDAALLLVMLMACGEKPAP